MGKAKFRFLDPNITSVTEMMEVNMRKNWELPAYTNYGTPQTYTYGDVAKMIERLHDMFRKLGIEKGDKIALCDKNNCHWAISFHAILSYGAVVVPILADFSLEQVANIYEHSEAKLMVCGGRYVSAINVPVLKNEDYSMSDGSMAIDMDTHKDMKPEDMHYFRDEPEELALISYTSGSTGRSKGVMLPYRSIWSNMIFADEVLDIKPGDHTLAILPMAHMYGFAFDFFFEFLSGCHVHFLTKTPSPNVVINAFKAIKPIIVIVVPLILEKIVQKQIFPILRTRSIRALTSIPLLRDVVYRQIRNKLYDALGGSFYECIIGGAAFNKEVEDFLNLIRFPYTVGYGMTECGPIIGYEDWQDFKKGSCGKAAPRMEVQVLSRDPEHEAGEIVTRGANVMLGYYKNEEETKEAIDNGGWLHTGDLGIMDKEGNIFIRGRKKTMLLGANGQNVYPEEIEDVIASQTIFEECVVVQRGEKLVALVYISDPTLEHHGLNRESLKAQLAHYKRHINSHLPNFSHIADIEVREEEFEKTPKKSIRRYLYK